MYAVVAAGGKQYRVQPEAKLKLEKLAGKAGDVAKLEQVALLHDGSTLHTGAPYINGAAVYVIIESQEKDDKVIIFKKKRRHNYRRKKGHRQQITVARVLQIAADGKLTADVASLQQKIDQERAKKQSLTQKVEGKSKNTQDVEDVSNLNREEIMAASKKKKTTKKKVAKKTAKKKTAKRKK